MSVPDGYAEVWFQIRYAGLTESMFTSMAYALDPGDTVTQAKVNAGFDAWQDAFATLYPNTVNLEGGHIILGSPAGDTRVDDTVVGSNGGNPNPAAVAHTAVLVTKNGVPVAPRRNRGRMFWPGPTDEAVDSAGILTEAARNGWQAAVDKLMPGGVIHSAFEFLAQAVLLHPAREPGTNSPTDPGAPELAPSTITSLSVQTRVATQRRRLRR